MKLFGLQLNFNYRELYFAVMDSVTPKVGVNTFGEETWGRHSTYPVQRHLPFQLMTADTSTLI